MATCYRHPGRETGVSCSSCGRPICPDCMTPTPVGMRCPECARQRTQVRTAASIGGAGGMLVTRILVAVNVIVFVAEASAAAGHPSGGTVYLHGALHGPSIAIGHEYWRLITCGFLHDPRMPFGLLHIGLNMYLLWVLGRLVEPSLGSVRFAAVYLTSLLAGSLGALLLTPDAVTVGASGAVFGLMGAAFVDLRRRGIDPFQAGIGSLILINVVFSFSVSNISIGGHLGGLAGGALATLALHAADRRRMRPLGLVACLLLAVIAAGAGIAAAHSGLSAA